MSDAGKKSFILFTDYRKHIDQLSSEEAGNLFKAILAYVDEGIELDLDRTTHICFSFIQTQLDRDNCKWNNIKEKRFEAGKKGGISSGISRNKQNEANVASASNSKQNEANEAVSVSVDVNGTVNVNDNVSVNGTVIMEQEPVSPDGETSPSVNYQHIVDMFNSICISYPKVTKLSDERRKVIKARLKQYIPEDFHRLFERAEESSFLKGGNNRSWTATFDWLIKDANIAKVLDGNYDNGTGSIPSSKDRNYDEPW